MFIQFKYKFTTDHLHCIGRGIDFYSSKYDNFIVPGDLNTEVSKSFLEQFCASYSLKSLVKELTCLKKWWHDHNYEFKDELIRELSCNNMQSDDLARFTNIPKIILEKRHLWKKGVSDISKLNLWTKICKKQLWIVPGC